MTNCGDVKTPLIFSFHYVNFFINAPYTSENLNAKRAKGEQIFNKYEGPGFSPFLTEQKCDSTASMHLSQSLCIHNDI